MELRQLEAFRAIAETGSFTRAAARLNLTQSAISQQIKALEDELGEPLFARTKRSVKLSPSGEVALRQVDIILSSVRELKGQFQAHRHLACGRLRVAAASQAIAHLFAPFYGEFKKSFSQIELSFRTTISTRETIEEVLANAVDVGFASLPVNSPELEVEPLFEDELALVVGSAHPFARASSVTVERLRSERFILYEPGTSIRQTTDSFFQQAQLAPEVAMESNDTDFINGMVKIGLGISFMPRWAVVEDIKRGDLKAVRVKGWKMRRSVAMVWLKRYQPAAVKTFLNFMRAHSKALQKRASGLIE